MTDSWTHVVQKKQTCCQAMYENRLQINMVKLGNQSEGSVIHSGE